MSTRVLVLVMAMVACVLGSALVAYGFERRYTVLHLGEGLLVRTDHFTGRTEACEIVYPPGRTGDRPPEIICGTAQ